MLIPRTERFQSMNYSAWSRAIHEAIYGSSITRAALSTTRRALRQYHNRQIASPSRTMPIHCKTTSPVPVKLFSYRCGMLRRPDGRSAYAIRPLGIVISLTKPISYTPWHSAIVSRSKWRGWPLLLPTCRKEESSSTTPFHNLSSCCKLIREICRLHQ